MSHYVIHVPGILDDIAKVQSTLFGLWRRFDIVPVTHVMPWLGEERYEASALDLLRRIDSLREQGHVVSLIGSSAGASAVLNAYQARPAVISAVILVCPKVNNSDNIGSKITNKNPSFVVAMKVLNKKLPLIDDQMRRRIVTFVSPGDRLVPYEDSVIRGVKEIGLPSLRHNFAVLYTLSFGASKINTELRRLGSEAVSEDGFDDRD